MEPNIIVSREDWIAARKALLAREKEFTRARDALSETRRQLPWVKVDKDYVFEGPGGKQSLADLFDGRSQLIVYHFMFGDDWDEGCSSCSFWADNLDGIACAHCPLLDLPRHDRTTSLDREHAFDRHEKMPEKSACVVGGPDDLSRRQWVEETFEKAIHAKSSRIQGWSNGP